MYLNSKRRAKALGRREEVVLNFGAPRPRPPDHAIKDGRGRRRERGFEGRGRVMRGNSAFLRLVLSALLLCAAAGSAAAVQRSRRAPAGDEEFGPIVRTYLSYLRDQ